MGVCGETPEESQKVVANKALKRTQPKPSPKGRRTYSGYKPLSVSPRRDAYVNKALVAKVNEVLKQNQRDQLEMSFQTTKTVKHDFGTSPRTVITENRTSSDKTTAENDNSANNNGRGTIVSEFPITQEELVALPELPEGLQLNCFEEDDLNFDPEQDFNPSNNNQAVIGAENLQCRHVKLQIQLNTLAFPVDKNTDIEIEWQRGNNKFKTPTQTMMAGNSQTKFRSEWYIKTTIQFDNKNTPKPKNFYLRVIRQPDKKLLGIGKGDLSKFGVEMQKDSIVQFENPKYKGQMLPDSYMIVKLQGQFIDEKKSSLQQTK